MRPQIEKLDDVDVVFLNEPWSPEEAKAFSEYLLKRKLQRAKRLASAQKKGHLQT